MSDPIVVKRGMCVVFKPEWRDYGCSPIYGQVDDDLWWMFQRRSEP